MLADDTGCTIRHLESQTERYGCYVWIPAVSSMLRYPRMLLATTYGNSPQHGAFRYMIGSSNNFGNAHWTTGGRTSRQAEFFDAQIDVGMSDSRSQSVSIIESAEQID